MGLTYENVQEQLASLEWPEGVAVPSVSSVGHWFNGTRRPRDMEHLKALCDVLKLSLDEAVKGDAVTAVTGIEQGMIEALRDMTPSQAEALLLMAQTLRATKPDATPS